MSSEDLEKICLCKDLSREDLILAIRNGATSIKKIAQATTAMTSCGTCIYDIEEILEEEKRNLDNIKTGQNDLFE